MFDTLWNTQKQIHLTQTNFDNVTNNNYIFEWEPNAIHAIIIFAWVRDKWSARKCAYKISVAYCL